MYVIFDPARPHIALEAAESLDAIAAALAVRSESSLTVCVNQDGLTHVLSDAEQRTLDQRLAQMLAR